MPDTLLFQLVSPERVLVETQVTEVEIPAREGYIGVLPGHAPLLSELKAGGVLTFHAADGTKQVIAVYGGFVEVLPDRVRVLADSAEHKEEIDVAAARVELKDAMKEMENVQSGAGDLALALDQAMRAQAKIDAAGKTA